MAQRAQAVPKEEPKKRVIAKFRQYYEGGEAKAEDRYCLLLVSPQMKASLLQEEKDAVNEVMMAFFRAELLLIGSGLIHSIKFMEEKDLVGQHEAACLEL